RDGGQLAVEAQAVTGVPGVAQLHRAVRHGEDERAGQAAVVVAVRGRDDGLDLDAALGGLGGPQVVEEDVGEVGVVEVLAADRVGAGRTGEERVDPDARGEDGDEL